MKKMVLGLIIFMLAGCGGGGGNQELKDVSDDNQLYEKVYVDINLQNEQTDEYYLFLVKPGKIGTDGAPTSTNDFYGPIAVEDFQAKIEVVYNSGIERLLEAIDEDYLQLVVTTREDFLIRNPLNEEVLIYFDGEDWRSPLATEEKFVIDIVDKYPDGVISLPWPEADFVVKLNFKEGITPRHSYSVCLRQVDLTRPGGITVLCLGAPLSNESNYYNAVFYSEGLENYIGLIEIIGQQPNRVSYADEPIQVEFDRFGKPIGDSVVEVTIIEGE